MRLVTIFTKGVSDPKAGQAEAQHGNKSQNIHMAQPSFPRFPFQFTYRAITYPVPLPSFLNTGIYSISFPCFSSAPIKPFLKILAVYSPCNRDKPLLLQLVIQFLDKLVGSRKPKADLTAALAQALDVAPQALDIPDIDSYIGPMHTLFTRRDKHFVAYFLAALLAPCPRRLYRCPKSLEVVFRYWSFCHNYSPYYILLFTFPFEYVYIVLSVSQNNSKCNRENFVFFMKSSKTAAILFP